MANTRSLSNATALAGIPRQPVRHPTIFGRYREFDEFLRRALCASDRQFLPVECERLLSVWLE